MSGLAETGFRRPGLPERICVVGLGYIGLPTALLFAGAGREVLGVDIDPGRRAAIAAGRAPFAEPGLDARLARAVGAGLLQVAPAPARSAAFLIAVPTPLGPGQKPDLGHVRAAAEAIAPHLSQGALVILESTVPVGTTARLAAWLADLRPDLGFPGEAGAPADVAIAHCPERVLPGRILAELVANDRVIGGLDRASAEAAAALYAPIVEGACHLTDAATAEMAKLAENAYRDVNIAFANELALIADRVGVDVWDAIGLANRHPRVDILKPGPGVGGHCIAIDPWFLAAAAPGAAQLIRTAREINDARPLWVAERAATMVGDLPRPAIACLGLAYKADVDDLRESPALEVVRHLAARARGPILVAEPHIDALPPALSGLPGVHLRPAAAALAEADLAVLLVDHGAFRSLPLPDGDGPRLFDTRGVWCTADLPGADASAGHLAVC